MTRGDARNSHKQPSPPPAYDEILLAGTEHYQTGRVGKSYTPLFSLSLSLSTWGFIGNHRFSPSSSFSPKENKGPYIPLAYVLPPTVNNS